MGMTSKSIDKKDVREVFKKNITVEEPPAPSWELHPGDTKAAGEAKAKETSEKPKAKGGKRYSNSCKTASLRALALWIQRWGTVTTNPALCRSLSVWSRPGNAERDRGA